MLAAPKKSDNFASLKRFLEVKRASIDGESVCEDRNGVLLLLRKFLSGVTDDGTEFVLVLCGFAMNERGHIKFAGAAEVIELWRTAIGKKPAESLFTIYLDSLHSGKWVDWVNEKRLSSLRLCVQAVRAVNNNVPENLFTPRYLMFANSPSLQSAKDIAFLLRFNGCEPASYFPVRSNVFLPLNMEFAKDTALSK